jgi:3-oxoacyl-[acyl-carrier-protein] synthase-1
MATASAAGLGLEALATALRTGRGGLRHNDFERADVETWIGRVEGLEDVPVTGSLARFDCRNNRLAQLGLSQDGFEAAVARARARYGAARIGVFIGTSTSGILETELAYQARDASGALPPTLKLAYSHNVFSVADFVRHALQMEGPALAVSTACSSSAKVFANAQRYMAAGLCDAAVVGGVDSLCLTTLHGFASLELTSPTACRPCDAARDGISIGEAAGFALLERADAAEGDIFLLGTGESSDAYHMSSPHPEGEGALRAMQAALAQAGLTPEEIDYINLHGTGTPSNDRSEERAVVRLFGTGDDSPPCSSTKGWTGHTLGAAGITEAIISALCLRLSFVPGTLNCRTVDPAFSARIALATTSRPLRRVLSNSFGFGGSNCSLVLGRATS